MADRTVTTRLVAKVTDYVSGLKAADRATKGVTEELVDAARAGKAMGAAGVAGGAQAAAGFKVAESAARRLDGQIDETTRSVRDLAREIAHAGDEAERAKLTEKLKVELVKKRDLVNLRKLVDPDEADRMGLELGAKIGVSAGRGFFADFSAQLGKMVFSPAGAVIGTAIAVPAAAALAGGISGAVIGGAGLGGVIGGITIAAKDARVQAAASQLGETFRSTMERSAVAFVPATLGGIEQIREMISGIEPDLRAIFDRSATFVEPLIRGVNGFIRGALPGFRSLVEAAGPVIRELSDGLPRIGDALGDVMRDISGDADAGASAVRGLIMGIEGGIRFVGGFIGLLVDLYRVLLDVGLAGAITADALTWDHLPIVGERIAKTRDRLQEMKDALEQGGEKGAEAGTEISGGFTKVTSAALAAAGGIRNFAEAVDDATGENIDAERSMMRLEEAIDAATEAGRKNNDGIDRGTAKGRANRSMLLDLAEATKANAANIFKMTGSQDLATAATEKGRAAFLKAADAMDVEKGEAIALANQLFGIPDDVTTNAHFNPANKAVSNWKRTLSGIPREIFTSARLRAIVNIETRREQATQATGRRWGGITEHAQSGLLREADIFAPRSPARYAFAEPATGGEAFVPRFGDRERSLAILDQAAGWYGKTLASRAPTYMGQMGAGGMRVVNVTYNIPVSVAAGANPAEGGRQVVEQIRAYEHRNGPGWRS